MSKFPSKYIMQEAGARTKSSTKKILLWTILTISKLNYLSENSPVNYQLQGHVIQWFLIRENREKKKSSTVHITFPKLFYTKSFITLSLNCYFSLFWLIFKWDLRLQKENSIDSIVTPRATMRGHTDHHGKHGRYKIYIYPPRFNKTEKKEASNERLENTKETFQMRF